MGCWGDRPLACKNEGIGGGCGMWDPLALKDDEGTCGGYRIRDIPGYMDDMSSMCGMRNAESTRVLVQWGYTFMGTYKS